MIRYIKIAFCVLVFVYFIFSILYIKNLKNDLSTSEANNAVLLNAQQVNSETIEKLKSDNQKVTELNHRYIDILVSQQDQLSDLNKKLDRLDEIAKKKPHLLENIINKGSDKTIRCFEDISDNKEDNCK